MKTAEIRPFDTSSPASRLPASDEIARIIVAAKHFGLALQPWDGKTTELEIRLPAMVVIEGRLLTPDRRPAGDVVVKSTWLTQGSDFYEIVDQFLDEKDYPPYWPKPVRSNAGGGFTLNGMPARIDPAASTINKQKVELSIEN